MEHRIRNCLLFHPQIKEDEINEYCILTSFLVLLKMRDGKYYIYDEDTNSIRWHAYELPEVTQMYGWILADFLCIRATNTTELAERTGIAQPTISRYINGITAPSYVNALKIAQALRFSLDKFHIPETLELYEHSLIEK